MSDQFEALVPTLIGVEGGYSNNPSDRGGETIWGITEANARKYGYTGPMIQMPQTEAKRIYRIMCWEEPKLNLISTVSDAVTRKVFDCGVNQGMGQAVIYLQRVLNVLNEQGRDWPDLPVTGHIGDQTVSALRALMQKRGWKGERALLNGINSLQGATYIGLAEKRESQETFENGWLLNRLGY